jgi:hypothetical protein
VLDASQSSSALSRSSQGPPMSLGDGEHFGVTNMASSAKNCSSVNLALALVRSTSTARSTGYACAQAICTGTTWAQVTSPLTAEAT